MAKYVDELVDARMKHSRQLWNRVSPLDGPSGPSMRVLHLIQIQNKMHSQHVGLCVFRVGARVVMAVKYLDHA